jgi:ribosome biogenesis protein ERB1
VAFNPNTSHHVLAVAVGSRLVLITTGTGDADAAEVTEALLASAESAAMAAAASKGDNDDDDGSDEDADGDEEESGGNKRKRKTVCSWHTISAPSSSSSVPAQDLRHGARVGPRAYLQFAHDVTSTTWHNKGDYLATLCPGDNSKSLAVHQVSKAKSQTPFNKNPGLVQAVLFHPTRPFVFVATQQHVKVFNLVEQKMVKRLLSGCKWLSCMTVHPQGDHIVVASYDRRVVWFDLDLSSTPHKTLKFHEKAVRSVQFHPRYPLLASASDDGTVHVFHSTVYRLVLQPLSLFPFLFIRSPMYLFLSLLSIFFSIAI